MDFKVVELARSKMVIKSQVLAEYQNAPPKVRELVQQLAETHKRDWEDRLTHLAPSGGAEAPEPEETADPRPGAEANDAIEPATPLETVTSEEALKEKVKILGETKAQGGRGVILLRTNDDAVWAVSRVKDHVILANTVLGGVGGGKLVATSPTAQPAVPFRLPKGDKTIVVGQGANEDDDNEHANTKVVSLYTLVRQVQKAAGGKAYSLTSYGQLAPRQDTLGNRGYGFEAEPKDVPADNDKFKSMSFLPRTKDDPKLQPANVFKVFACERSLQGPVAWAWRLQEDKIHAKLCARKPFVTTTRSIELKKGQPAKIAWRGP